MLEKLVLNKFQCHRKLVLTFDPNVTTIIGPSDVGKSTVIRALRWLCLNQSPLNPDELIHWDFDGTRVKLVVDGRAVTRRRGKGVNTYELDGKEFKAFGNTVPPEIAALLNVGEANFQKQLDAHYWFSQTPGQVSRELNQIVNLQAIDTTLANVATELRKARAEVEVTERRLLEARVRKKELAWVPGMASSLASLEAKSATLAKTATVTQSMASAMQLVSKSQAEAKRAADWLYEGRKVVTAGEKASETASRANGLRNLLGELRTASKASKRTAPNMEELHRPVGKLVRLSEEALRLEKLLKQMREQLGHVSHTKGQLNYAKNELEQYTRGQLCPVCGNLLK